MVTLDLAERVQLLHADLNRVRREGQYLGSGATIHRLINQVSTAQGALRLVETRYSAARRDDIELLLALAEECLRTARKLLAQTSHTALLRRIATVAAS